MALNYHLWGTSPIICRTQPIFDIILNSYISRLQKGHYVIDTPIAYFALYNIHDSMFS